MRLASLILAGLLVAVPAHAAPLGDLDRAEIDSLVLADMDDASFDTAFVCPEILPTDDDREADFERYTAWAHVRHPDWNFRKRLDVRLGLLRRHGCAATLSRVTDSRRPAFPGLRK